VPAHDIKPPIGQRSDRLASEMANLDLHERALRAALCITHTASRHFACARAIDFVASSAVLAETQNTRRSTASRGARESI
jgi:hypothetical protein